MCERIAVVDGRWAVGDGTSRTNRVSPGDGSALPPFRPHQSIWRALLEIDHGDHRYAMDVDFFVFTDRGRLYRDGEQVAVARLPASFPVDGGHIEVATSMYGLSRAHLVIEGTGERPLRPVPQSAEGWRARLAHRRPMLSRCISAVSIVILVVALLLQIPQLIEMISGTDLYRKIVGDEWESPIDLPASANTVIIVAGVLAALERALSIRSNRFVDAETWWLD